MPLLLHKFRDHVVNTKAEILIIGTFNPDIPGGPDFFYGRPQNYLWQLLPQAYGLASLKYAALEAKEEFMREYHIDFVDLIHSVDVEAGQEGNVEDIYIDDKVQHWKGLQPIIDQLPDLSAVFFTRKTFNYIPNITGKIRDIQEHVHDRGLYFACLETPARFINESKQNFWNSRLIGREACTAL